MIVEKLSEQSLGTRNANPGEITVDEGGLPPDAGLLYEFQGDNPIDLQLVYEEADSFGRTIPAAATVVSGIYQPDDDTRPKWVKGGRGGVTVVVYRVRHDDRDIHNVLGGPSSTFAADALSDSDASPQVAADHHAIDVDENTGTSFNPIDFPGLPTPNGAGWIKVSGMVWFELRARAIDQDQVIRVEARYSLNGETIDLVSDTTLTAGGAWTDFLDRTDDTTRAVVGFDEARIMAKDNGNGTGTLEAEGGIT